MIAKSTTEVQCFIIFFAQIAGIRINFFTFDWELKFTFSHLVIIRIDILTREI